MKNFTAVCLLFLVLMNSNLYLQTFSANSEIEITTHSAEAFERFIIARDYLEQLEFDSASINLDIALKEDKNFTLANLYKFLFSEKDSAAIFLANAEKGKENISSGEKLLFEFAKYFIDDDFRNSKKILEELVENFPLDKRVRNLAGVYLINQNEFPDAVYQLKAAIQLDSTFIPAYLNLASASIHLNNFEAAEESYNKVLELNPQNHILNFHYGKFLLLKGKYEFAADKFIRSNELKPNNESLIFLGAVYLLEGYCNLARENFDLVSINSNSINEKESAVYFKTLSYLYENNLEAAKKIFSSDEFAGNGNNENWLYIKTALNVYEYPMLIFSNTGNPFDKEILKKAIYKKLFQISESSKKIKMIQEDFRYETFISNN